MIYAQAQQTMIAAFVLITSILCFEPVRANFVIPFGRQQKKCMENNALLLEHVDTLEKENLQLRQLQAKDRRDLSNANDRVSKLNGIVENLRVRNTDWAVKINDMKLRLNTLKHAAVREDYNTMMHE